MSEAERLAKWIEEDMSCQGDAEVVAELRRLSAELEECQAQRRAAFRRIEEQDKELEALNKAMGEPVGHAAYMPGTTGFTMAAFRSEIVPVGSALYALTKDQS